MQRTQSAVRYSKEEEALARIAKALSHPVRIRILQLLLYRFVLFYGSIDRFHSYGSVDRIAASEGSA